MTRTYAIDPIAIAAQSARAAERSAAGEGPELASRLRGGKTLEFDALAALFLSEEVSTDELLEIARQRREAADGPNTSHVGFRQIGRASCRAGG